MGTQSILGVSVCVLVSAKDSVQATVGKLAGEWCWRFIRRPQHRNASAGPSLNSRPDPAGFPAIAQRAAGSLVGFSH
ncbi:hypothetical protein [Glutamicibacter sp. Je.9.36]|uniref:hypothetical protein n=1 Tax=Glutamicibacter sp. Je.9.36 TaxID=3142837 RepID=UPI003DA89F0C